MARAEATQRKISGGRVGIVVVVTRCSRPSPPAQSRAHNFNIYRASGEGLNSRFYYGVTKNFPKNAFQLRSRSRRRVANECGPESARCPRPRLLCANMTWDMGTSTGHPQHQKSRSEMKFTITLGHSLGRTGEPGFTSRCRKGPRR